MNRIFEIALKNKKIDGAYLLESATKEAFWAETDEFLGRVFCTDKTGCGVCPGCQKYSSKNHADLFILDSGEKSIKVEQAREIPTFVANKSYEGGYKAVIIPQAEQMTEPAQNALLKVLEEPPSHTIILLGAEDSKKLLPTVTSRCIIIKMQKREDAEAQLAKECGLPTLKAHVLMRVAEGDFYLAKEYAGKAYFDVREDIALALGRIIFAKSMATSAIEKLFLKHDPNLIFALEVAVIYLADILRCKHDCNHDVRNEDRLNEIARYAESTDRVLVCAIDALTALIAQREVCAGLNFKLALTKTLFNILEVVLI